MKYGLVWNTTSRVNIFQRLFTTLSQKYSFNCIIPCRILGKRSHNLFQLFLHS